MAVTPAQATATTDALSGLPIAGDLALAGLGSTAANPNWLYRGIQGAKLGAEGIVDLAAQAKNMPWMEAIRGAAPKWAGGTGGYTYDPFYKGAGKLPLSQMVKTGGDPLGRKVFQAATGFLPKTVARFAGPIGAAYGVGDLAYRGTSALLDATGGTERLENLGGNIYEYFNPEQTSVEEQIARDEAAGLFDVDERSVAQLQGGGYLGSIPRALGGIFPGATPTTILPEQPSPRGFGYQAAFSRDPAFDVNERSMASLAPVDRTNYERTVREPTWFPPTTESGIGGMIIEPTTLPPVETPEVWRARQESEAREEVETDRVATLDALRGMYRQPNIVWRDSLEREGREAVEESRTATLKALNPMAPTGDDWTFDDPKLINAILIQKATGIIGLTDSMNDRIMADLDITSDEYDSLIHLIGSATADPVVKAYEARDTGDTPAEAIQDQINNIVGKEHGDLARATGTKLDVKKMWNDSRISKDISSTIQEGARTGEQGHTLAALSELAATDPTMSSTEIALAKDLVKRYTTRGSQDLIDIATQQESFANIPEAPWTPPAPVIPDISEILKAYVPPPAAPEPYVEQFEAPPPKPAPRRVKYTPPKKVVKKKAKKVKPGPKKAKKAKVSKTAVQKAVAPRRVKYTPPKPKSKTPVTRRKGGKPKVRRVSKAPRRPGGR